MILFFGDPKLKVFVVKVSEELSFEDIKKLSWVLESDFIDLSDQLNLEIKQTVTISSNKQKQFFGKPNKSENIFAEEAIFLIQH